MKKPKLEWILPDLRPRYSSSYGSVVASRRAFGKVFEGGHHLCAQRLNQPNLGRWDLNLCSDFLARHTKCGIIAQPYSRRYGETGRPFCTKCGSLLGRGARGRLAKWEGETIPILQGGLQAFFLTRLTSEGPEEPEELEEPGEATPLLEVAHGELCGCVRCIERLAGPPEPSEPGGKQNLQIICWQSGLAGSLFFPTLELILDFPFRVFSEDCFRAVVRVLETLPASAPRALVVARAAEKVREYGYGFPAGHELIIS